MAQAPPAPPPSSTRIPDLHTFHHHWQDEADAAYLYRLLADAEQDAKKSDLYRRLAAVEDRHVEIWARLLREHGGDAWDIPAERADENSRQAREDARAGLSAADAAVGGGA